MKRSRIGNPGEIPSKEFIRGRLVILFIPYWHILKRF